MKKFRIQKKRSKFKQLDSSSMVTSINLCFSAADVRSETSKFETAEALSSPVGQGVWCTDKINGETVKNDDAPPARKDIAL